MEISVKCTYKSSPHLPHHDESTSNRGGGALEESRVSLHCFPANTMQKIPEALDWTNATETSLKIHNKTAMRTVKEGNGILLQRRQAPWST